MNSFVIEHVKVNELPEGAIITYMELAQGCQSKKELQCLLDDVHLR